MGFAAPSIEANLNRIGRQPGSTAPAGHRRFQHRLLRGHLEVPVFTRPSRRATAVLITAGALGVAVTTALEVLTAPYSPVVRAYPLNGAVHAVKVATALLFAAGMLCLAAGLHREGARIGAAAAVTLAGATAAGAIPYSIAETSLDPGLNPAAANGRLEEIYALHAWIGTTASIALPMILLGILTLAVVTLRRHLVPLWAPIASLAAIPVAVLAGLLGEAGWAVPHPPAWIFLGLTAYGPALLRTTAVPTRPPMPAAA